MLDFPFPSHRLASTALKALEVDEELSPLVRRTFSLEHSQGDTNGIGTMINDKKYVLRTEYRATTNRMLRVAVNGFMESIGVVLGVMAELDVDVLSIER